MHRRTNRRVTFELSGRARPSERWSLTPRPACTTSRSRFYISRAVLAIEFSYVVRARGLVHLVLSAMLDARRIKA